MIEAMLVAGITGVVGFVTIYFYNDCQPMKAEQEDLGVQVGLVTMFRWINLFTLQSRMFCSCVTTQCYWEENPDMETHGH